jgi:hypothetical protein
MGEQTIWRGFARQELEQFLELTNGLTRGTFGMDVQGYRRYKGLGGRASRLRDHIRFSNQARVRSAELAKTAKDMHNSTFPPRGKTVA